MNTELKTMSLTKKRKILGWVQIIQAISALIFVILALGFSNTESKFTFWTLIFILMPIFYSMAGIGVLKKVDGAILLSSFLQALAVLDIYISGSFSWKWKPGFELSYFYQTPTYGIGIDFLALVMLVVIFLIAKEDYAQQGAQVDA